MIEIKDEKLIDIITHPGRTFAGKIILGEETYSEILSIKYKAPFCVSGALSIGETPSAMIDVEIADISPDIRGMELEAVISIENQAFSQGFFTVDDPIEKGGIVRFTAYDRMNGASKKTYISELVYPTNVQNVFNEICEQFGCVADNVLQADNIVVESDVLSGYDCRTALGYLAAYIGKNCICDIDGKFKMQGYTVTNETINEDTIAEPEVGKETSSLSYLSCTVSQDIVYKSGEGTQGIGFVCPLMTQERLDSILHELVGTEEVPGILKQYFCADIEQLCGDPRFTPGDVITLETSGKRYNVPIMNVERDFDGGLSCIFNSYEPATDVRINSAEKIELLKKESVSFKTAQTMLTERMMNALGLFCSQITLADGGIKYYFHNKAELSESTYIIALNASGFAWTDKYIDEEKTVWKYGFTEGNAILNYLIANKITADMINTESLFAKDIIASGVLKSLQQDDKSRLIFDFANGEIRTDYDGGMFDGANVFNLSNKRFRYTRTVVVDGVEYQDYVALQPNGLLIQRTQGLKTVKEYNLNFGAFGEGFDSFFTNLRVGQIAVSDFYYSKDWTVLSLSNGAKAVSGGGFTEPKYRAFGDRIDIQGAVQFNSNGTTAVHIATLPSGYRPINTIYFAPYVFDTANSGYNYSRGYINSDGKIFFQWAYKINDGTPITINNTKAQINCIID